MKTAQFLSLTEQIKLSPNQYLYEGLSKDDQRSVLLWETAGRKIVEATLTADQIQQIFQQIQTNKDNRTMLGKGKDVASAVNKAWEDLKTKVSTSGPVQNFDALYDQAAEKLKQATGGDQGAMTYVQKYRDFAKKHPIAQGFIYAALIGAAGISGAGVGGAAALGLLKMTDKLLQGEKFSSAAYQGAKTGAMAYGASKLADYFKGDKKLPPGTDKLGAEWLAHQKAVAQELLKNYTPADFDYVSNGMDINVIEKATGQLVKTVSIGTDPDMGVINPAGFISKLMSGEFGKAATSAVSKASRDAANAAFDAAHPNFESRKPKSVALTETQIIAVFNRVERINNKMLAEGRLFEAAQPKAQPATAQPQAQSAPTATAQPAAGAPAQPAQPKQGLMGKVGSALGKGLGAVGKGLGKVGRSMTAKVSSDRLTKAWQDAGSPTDSVEIEKILQAQGVNPEVVSTVFKANNIPVTIKPAPTAAQGQTPAVFTPGGNRQAGSAPATQPAPGTTAPAATATTTAGQAALATRAPSTGSATPATAPASAPASAPAQITAADIRKAIPTMKIGDLRSIKKSIETILSVQDKKRASGKAPKASQPKAAPAAKSAPAAKVSAPRNPGAPTDQEYANFQQKLQAAKQAQGV